MSTEPAAAVTGVAGGVGVLRAAPGEGTGMGVRSAGAGAALGDPVGDTNRAGTGDFGVGVHAAARRRRVARREATSRANTDSAYTLLSDCLLKLWRALVRERHSRGGAIRWEGHWRNKFVRLVTKLLPEWLKDS